MKSNHPKMGADPTPETLCTPNKLHTTGNAQYNSGITNQLLS